MENAAVLLGLDHIRLTVLRDGKRRALATGGPDPNGPRDCRLSDRFDPGESVWMVEDFSANSQFRDAPEAAEGWRSGVAVPFFGGGALIALRRASGPFSGSALAHLHHLAEWAAIEGFLSVDGTGAAVSPGKRRSDPRPPSTDRLEEIRRLNALLLDSLPYPAMLIRADRTVVAANRIAREMGAKAGGYCRCDFAGSESGAAETDPDAPREARSDSAAPCRFCLAEEVFRTGEPRRNPELSMGGQIWDTWWVPVDESLFLHYAVNITDQKAREVELKAARRAAEKAGRAKSHFLAKMSHEIRKPMNTVIGMIELALDDELSPRPRDMLETARTSAEDLRALLDDILDLSKIEAGQLALEIAEFDPARLVADVARALEPRARKKGLGLRTVLAPDLPERFRGAPRRLRQVLNNLVENALKFTRTGGVTVTAGPDAEAKSNPEGWTALRFAVCDTGPGIPADQLDRVFDAFSRGDDADHRRFEGAGLGATISRELVAAMGGELTVESRLGEGATFVFTVRGEALAPSGADSTDAAAPVDVPEDAGPLRILLAEDNPMNQKLVESLLVPRGHAVDIASDGKAALERLGEAAYDLVLMDIQMPGMDGLEATRRLRTWESDRGSRVPVYALGARVLNGEREQCIAAGMDGFIPKPIRREDLFRVLAGLSPSRAASASSAPSPAPKSGEPPLDREGLLDIVGGLPRIARELIRLYRQNCPELVEKVRRAVEAADARKLKESAHALKGMSLNLSAGPVAEASLRLERLGRSEDLTHAAREFQTLEEEVARLKKELDIFLEALEPD
ncbi:MAG: ATP-binding protein [Desulfococcaceae bacterium]